MHDEDEPYDAASERNETPAERLDRNWSELLQELRVTQTGIQILSGFPRTLPFQARFTELDAVLKGVFLGAVAMGRRADRARGRAGDRVTWFVPGGATPRTSWSNWAPRAGQGRP